MSELDLFLVLRNLTRRLLHGSSGHLFRSRLFRGALGDGFRDNLAGFFCGGFFHGALGGHRRWARRHHRDGGRRHRSGRHRDGRRRLERDDLRGGLSRFRFRGRHSALLLFVEPRTLIARRVDLVPCKLPREAEREVSRIASAHFLENFFGFFAAMICDP